MREGTTEHVTLKGVLKAEEAFDRRSKKDHGRGVSMQGQRNVNIHDMFRDQQVPEDGRS